MKPVGVLVRTQGGPVSSRLMGSGCRAVGLQQTIPGKNPFLLHFAVQSVLKIGVEASEKPTQSFEILNIIRGAHSFWP